MLAEASKLKSMGNKQTHILKRLATERQEYVRESSVKENCKRSNQAWAPSSRSKRRGNKVALQVLGRSLSSGENTSASTMALPE
jgi:hypothetical protein